MPEDNSSFILKFLSRKVYETQQILNKRLKMRPVPRIEWVLETKTVEAQEIEKILDKIKKEK